MSYWACASLEQNRVRLALHFLDLAGFTTYTPRVSVERRPGASANGSALLFPGYTFLAIVLQWHAANRSPGVMRLIMDGEHPARVPDRIIAGLRAREGPDGAGEVAAPTPIPAGDLVRVVRGALSGQLGFFDDMRPRERVAVLLAFLGGMRRVELSRRDVARVP